jgi:acyl-CoA thioesterase
MKEKLMDGAPSGSILSCHPSGWMQIDIFTAWLDHFVHFIKPSADDPVLLIVDGHYSHTKKFRRGG